MKTSHSEGQKTSSESFSVAEILSLTSMMRMKVMICSLEGVALVTLEASTMDLDKWDSVALTDKQLKTDIKINRQKITIEEIHSALVLVWEALWIKMTMMTISALEVALVDLAGLARCQVSTKCKGLVKWVASPPCNQAAFPEAQGQHL